MQLHNLAKIWNYLNKPSLRADPRERQNLLNIRRTFPVDSSWRRECIKLPDLGIW